MAPDSVPVSSSAAAPQDAATLAADHGYGGLTYFPKAKISKSKPNPPLPTSTRNLLDSVLHLDSLPDIPDDEFLENLLFTLTQHNKANPITPDIHDIKAVPQALNLFHHIGDDDMLLNVKSITPSDLGDLPRQTTPTSPGSLMLVWGILNGVRVRCLVDSGCTIETLVDTNTAARADLHTDHNRSSGTVKVGDGREVSTRHSTKTKVNISGYETWETPQIMDLSKKFDVVLGKPWLEKIERRSMPGTFAVSFVQNSLQFTTKTAVKGKRHFHISSQLPDPAAIAAPHYNSVYLSDQFVSGKDLTADDLKAAKMIMMDGSGNVLDTKDGHQYINLIDCDIATTQRRPSSLFASDAPETQLFQEGGGCSAVFSPSAKSDGGSGADSADGADVVRKAVESADPANWTVPDANPNWEPREPDDNDDFSDPDFLSRVNPKQNNLEKLQKIDRDAQAEGMPGSLIDDVFKKCGQIFRDTVPAKLIEDRGSWNAELRFAKSEDAHSPINQKCYRLSPDETKAVAEILRENLQRGTIRPSKSPWGTPIFLVPKADGGWRLCCDYRLLNARLVHESYNIPAADQLFDQLQGAKYFSSHDCTWGYNQLRWKKESIPVTAIKTHLGTFEFLVMNFGPTSAPAQWQRLMEAVLRPVLNDCCLIFLDDLIVFSKTAAEHKEHLLRVYRLLAKNRIYLRFCKCYFFQRQLKYLGWIVGHGELRSDPEKVEVLKTWTKPDSKREVRSFTGFCNFYRRLIPKYSNIMSPLFDLQRDEVPDDSAKFSAGNFWKPEHTVAFNHIIKLLTSDPVVKIADPAVHYHLKCDASEVAVGGVLEQAPENAPIYVVAYYSKRLGNAQRNYAPGKLELLALIVCLQQWRHYLLGAKAGFTVFTDHEPLLAIRSTKNPSRMLLRWLAFIEEFRFTIKALKGIDTPADMLSRPPAGSSTSSPLRVTENDSSNDHYPDIASFLAVFTSYLALDDDSASHSSSSSTLPSSSDDFIIDDICLATVQKLRSATVKDALFLAVKKDPVSHRGRFIIKDGLLFHILHNNHCLFIPTACIHIRRQVFAAAHGLTTSGHWGLARTLMKIQRSYWWPSMKADIKEWIDQCRVCVTSKRLHRAQPPLLTHDVPHTAWEVVFMDETSGFPASNGYDAIWIFVDKLTKMAHFVPVVKKGLTAAGLADLFFTHVFRLHGMPSKLVSDRDDRINNEFWQQLFRRAQVIVNMSTGYHPQTDSSGEATVRTCIDLCRTFVNSNRDDWYELLPALEFAYNDSPGPTGLTPFELNYNRHPRSAFSRLIEAACRDDPAPGKSQSGLRALRRYGRALQQVRRHMRQQAQSLSDPTPVVTRQLRHETFKVGQKVMLHRSYAGASFPQDKMARLYVGPFTITKVISKVAYELDLPSSMQVNRVQNIRSLKAASPDLTPELAKSGPPEAPSARLQADPLEIQSMHIVTDADDYVDLCASTNLGVYLVHELCNRSHFAECYEYLEKHIWNHKFPYSIGRRCVVNKGTYGPETGLVTAYDPHEADRAYQLDFADPTRSHWAARQKFKLLARGKKPTQNVLAKLSSGHPLRILELCSGPNSSFSSQMLERFPNAHVVTIDSDSSCSPTIVADIRHWDYRNHFKPGFFHIVWASPPCTNYSPANKSSSTVKMEEADDIVRAALRVISVAKAPIWFLENPHTKLFQRPFMLPLEAQRFPCTYCMYGTNYKKQTDIWTNVPLALHHCDRPGSCCQSIARYGRHLRTAQQGPSTTSDGYTISGISAQEANIVPVPLLNYIIDVALFYIKDISAQ